MPTYYVWSGAGGSNAGTSWTNAFTAFGSAVQAANATNDVILVHKAHQENLAVNTTYTFLAAVSVISVDRENNDALSAMGTGGWIGSNSAARDVLITGAFKIYMYGITFQTASTGLPKISINRADGGHFELESCYLWAGTTVSGNSIFFGSTNTNTYTRLVNCTLRFGNVGQLIGFSAGRLEFEGCSFAPVGSVPTTLFDDLWNAVSTDSSSPDITLVGCDLSPITGTLVGSMGNQARTFRFVQCKLGVNVTTVTSVLASQTPANKSSGVVYLFDCNSGDTHGIFGYYDGLGSCVSDTGIYYTTGAAVQSWKIVTGPNCSFGTPFTTPFVDLYHTGTSSITPRFEILRDGSTTAFKNDEVWGEFFVKTTTASTQSTEYSDRRAVWPTANGNQDAGAGLGSWGGEAASAWSGKVDSGSAVTPAENGHIRGRVAVGAELTVYVDPQIRTA